ncbi:MAG TPA: substrate-binding domain-containing protein [Bryobacteraceae bacterium]|nr:substrate-binding domain-containing protein [Bryobacteraceae bacterium]
MALTKSRLALAAVFLLLTNAACNRSAKLRIAVVPKGQTHIFWQSVHAGAVKAGQELGADILWNGPAAENDLSGQIGIVENFISQHVDGIALAPAHGEALVPVVDQAAAAKIPVSIFDSGIKSDKYISYVSTDNYKGGAMAAARMAEILPKGGKIAIVATAPGGVSTVERENGFKETLAKTAPNLVVVAMQYGMSDRAKSLAVAEDILTANPDIVAIFCSNESGSIGAVQGAKSHNLAGKLKIVGFDSSPTLIEDLQAGNIDSLVVQNPFKMGYTVVQTLIDQLNGKPPEKRIDTGATLVTAANLKDPAVQDLLNPPIQKYLK